MRGRDSARPLARLAGTEFGTSGDWVAHEGDKLLIISTGTLVNPNAQGQVVLPAKDAQVGTPNTNLDNVANLPNPIEPTDGSGGTPFMNCDGMNDCSDTLEAQWALGGSRANELLFFKFDVTVPAEGYEFDFAFFSSEFPEWVDTQYNDVFVAWSTSETYTGNVTFIEGQPLTITALDTSIIYEGNDPQLPGVDGVGGGPMGRGMMEPVSGGTGWFTASGSAAPGETFTIAVHPEHPGTPTGPRLLVLHAPQSIAGPTRFTQRSAFLRATAISMRPSRGARKPTLVLQRFVPCLIVVEILGDSEQWQDSARMGIVHETLGGKIMVEAENVAYFMSQSMPIVGIGVGHHGKPQVTDASIWRHVG